MRGNQIEKNEGTKFEKFKSIIMSKPTLLLSGFILAATALIGYILNIPKWNWVGGSEEGWQGYWGTIIGIIGAYSILRIQLRNDRDQNQVQNIDNTFFHLLEMTNNNGHTSFLTKYYGNEIGQALNGPLHTVPTKDRFGLVTIEGVNYRIVDITLRMLQPHELVLGNGVRKSYIIDQDENGKRLSKAKQVEKIGNMVCPPCAAAIVRSNLPELCLGGKLVEQVELLNEDFGWTG